MSLIKLVVAMAMLACDVSSAVAVELVEFRTTLGNFEVELYPDAAPGTVANFLRYVDEGAYADSFFHRSVSNYILQGGGHTFTEAGGLGNVATQPPIAFEDSGFSNVRGTLTMARIGFQPNSATSQWFFNTDDNLELDTNNGGWTVFGRVLGDGMDVVDAIASLPTVNASSSFQNLPYLGTLQGSITVENLVYVNVVRVPEPATGLLGFACLVGSGSLRYRRKN